MGKHFKVIAGIGIGWLTAGCGVAVAEIVSRDHSLPVMGQAMLATGLIWGGMTVLLLLAGTTQMPLPKRTLADACIRRIAAERAAYQAQEDQP